ncbi:MAG: hypothetical protein J6U38_06705, partial [Clostridia bacterium]|nr:hypothetical protein [Clostridia bacterium]
AAGRFESDICEILISVKNVDEVPPFRADPRCPAGNCATFRHECIIPFPETVLVVWQATNLIFDFFRERKSPR